MRQHLAARATRGPNVEDLALQRQIRVATGGSRHRGMPPRTGAHSLVDASVHGKRTGYIHVRAYN